MKPTRESNEGAAFGLDWNFTGADVGTGSVATAKLAASSADEVAQLLADAKRVMKALDLKLADHGPHREMLKTIQWALIERPQLAGLYKTPYQDQPVELTLHPLRYNLPPPIYP